MSDTLRTPPPEPPDASVSAVLVSDFASDLQSLAEQVADVGAALRLLGESLAREADRAMQGRAP
jgi:hypothetical protein